MPTDFTPSRNENEYFTRENLDLLRRLRAERNAVRAGAGVGGAAHRMACPRCAGPLVEREYHHVMIDECAQCDGVWLDKGELALLEHVEPHARPSFLARLFRLDH